VPVTPVAPVIISRIAQAPTTSWRPGGPSVYAGLEPAAAPPTLCAVAPHGERQHVGAWALGITLAVLILGVTLALRATGGSRQPPPRIAVQRSVARQLEVLRETDPDFSVVLLEDFIYALYAEAHTARGQGQLGRLSPYLEEAAQQTLAELGATPVSTVVLGSMTLTSFQPGDPHWLAVELEANYTEGNTSYYARELWTLVRQASARSRPPARVRVLRCPNCDAPTDQIAGRVCGYCGETVAGGRHEWCVARIAILERVTRGPMLTGTTEEQGTDSPTLVDPELAASFAALAVRDPQFSEQGLRARVQLIFQTMQAAWSSLEWERARPFLSDRLHEAQSYWIRAYRAAGLRNVTEGARVTALELVRVTRDRWFDAVTVRLFASGLDYTRRESDGAIVGGSQTRGRSYSEYWTLIRSAERSGPAGTEARCPQCGAPLAVTMAGLCSHCQAKVNSGEFDWVLSRIEQDESYQG